MSRITPCAIGTQPNVVQQRPIPPPAVPAADTDAEIQRLLSALPAPVRDKLLAMERDWRRPRPIATLMELSIQVGRRAEATYTTSSAEKERQFVTDTPCTPADIQLFEPLFRDHRTNSHKRVGIPDTLHRLSLTTHPAKNETVIAVTARVGKALHGMLNAMAPFLLPGGEPLPPPQPRPLPPPPPQQFSGAAAAAASSSQQLSIAGPVAEHPSKSLLLIGRPGMGKTTLLRELAQALSTDMSNTVVVVDKTCEIAGDGFSPHSAIGSSRWMPVGKDGMQAQILRECVENQTPDTVICDEISTTDEVECVRSIAQRGVRLIATVHGCTLPELVNDGERRNLVGGQLSVTLTDAAAERRPDKRKQVQVRQREPAFAQAIELHERNRWVYHPCVKDAVDAFYSGEPSKALVLEPGRVLSAFALPENDGFTYCLECGRQDTLCEVHKPMYGARSAAGAGAGGRGQRSGACNACGEWGHFRIDPVCPRFRQRQ